MWFSKILVEQLDDPCNLLSLPLFYLRIVIDLAINWCCAWKFPIWTGWNSRKQCSNFWRDTWVLVKFCKVHVWFLGRERGGKCLWLITSKSCNLFGTCFARIPTFRVQFYLLSAHVSLSQGFDLISLNTCTCRGAVRDLPLKLGCTPALREDRNERQTLWTTVPPRTEPSPWACEMILSGSFW